MRRALICFRVGTEFWTMNLFVFFTLFFNKNIITTSCKDSDYSLLELKEYYARLINHDVCLISFLRTVVAILWRTMLVIIIENINQQKRNESWTCVCVHMIKCLFALIQLWIINMML